MLFRMLTDRLIQVGGADTTKQRLDSTTVRSAIRGLTRLGILVEAASKFLRELKRKQSERYSEVDAEIVRKYVERRGDGRFADTRPTESKRRLPVRDRRTVPPDNSGKAGEPSPTRADIPGPM
jgi:hypothetical protein